MLIFSTLVLFYSSLFSQANASTAPLCPGVDLVKTCGNLTCDAPKEDRVTCPADCIAAPVKTYNYQTLCTDVKQVFQPLFIDEIQEIITTAARNHQRVRVVGRAHSANSQICTDGVVIATSELTQIHGLEIFEGVETVRVEPGVSLGSLSDWLEKRDRTLGYGMLNFRGASVAGAVATASHGSSPKHSSVVSTLVRSIQLVNASGEIEEFSRSKTNAELWKSLTVNLGMFGVVTELRLEVRPQFNLRTEVSYLGGDELFNAPSPHALVVDCDYGHLNWFPATNKVMKVCGYETTEPAQKGAGSILLSPKFPDTFWGPFKVAAQLGACSGVVSCGLETARYLHYRMAPPLVRENKKGELESFSVVVGKSHQILSSPTFSHITGMFEMDWELAVPASEMKNALLTIRETVKEKGLCFPLMGVFMRFTIADDTSWIAHSAVGDEFGVGEPVMFVEIPMTIPVGFSETQLATYLEPVEALVRNLILHNHARGHWGKNRDWLFKFELRDGRFNQNRDKFLRSVQAMDPQGVFENQFSRVLTRSKKSSTNP